MGHTSEQAEDSIGAFVQRHGRPPMLGLEERPWMIRGWLLHYIQLAHFAHERVPNRWGYFLSLYESGELPGAPIPRLDFVSPRQGSGLAVLEDALELLFASHGGWSSLRLLLEWLGYGLMVHPHPPALSDELARVLYERIDACELLIEPSDYIGALISESKGRGQAWNPAAFFPTPHGVVEAMTRMLFFDVGQAGDTRLKSVCDPCMGTGRMLLHASNHSLALYGGDIDPLVLLGARINGALYAPWLAFPLPASLGPLTVAQELEHLEATRESPRLTARLAQVEDALGRPPASQKVLPVRGVQGELFEL